MNIFSIRNQHYVVWIICVVVLIVLPANIFADAWGWERVVLGLVSLAAVFAGWRGGCSAEGKDASTRRLGVILIPTKRVSRITVVSLFVVNIAVIWTILVFSFGSMEYAVVFLVGVTLSGFVIWVALACMFQPDMFTMTGKWRR